LPSTTRKEYLIFHSTSAFFGKNPVKGPEWLLENSTATLCGINERNFNRQPVTLWVRETQGGETRETQEKPFVYLSR